MQAQYLRKKDEKTVLAATPTLAARVDMFPCDKDGTILGPAARLPITAVNISAAAARVAKAMKITLEEAEMLVAGDDFELKAAPEKEAVKPVTLGVDAKTPKPTEPAPVEVSEKRKPPSQWSKPDILKHAVEDFGAEKVMESGLEANKMTKPDMWAIYEQLQAQKDLESAGATETAEE